MRKLSKISIVLLLVIVLCFSMMPISAMATGDTAIPGAADPSPEEPEENIIPTEPTTDENEQSGGDAPAESISDTATDEQAGEDFGPTWPEVSEQDEAPASVDANAETDNGNITEAKTNITSIATVVYHYFDTGKNPDIINFADYTNESTHIYHTAQTSDENGVYVKANMYPGTVNVSTDAIRFRVFLDYTSASWDGSISPAPSDVTDKAAYDPATGVVSLPLEYLNRDITVILYCPQTDVTELTVNANITKTVNGVRTSSTVTDQVLSNRNTLALEICDADIAITSVSVKQNGQEIPPENCIYKNGHLAVIAAPLGGDLDIVVSDGSSEQATPFARTMGVMSGGDTVQFDSDAFMPMSAGDTWNITSASITTLMSMYTGIHNAYGMQSHYPSYGFAVNISGCTNPALTFDANQIGTRGNGGTITGDGGVTIDVSDTANHYYVWASCSGNVDDNGRGVPLFQNGYVREVGFNSAMSLTEYYYFINCYSSYDGHAMQSIEGTFFANSVGDLEIQKVSGDPVKTDDNALYSLAGAVFDVFDSGNNKIGSITTDTDGKGKLEGITAGTGYYLVETSPPKGYAEYTDKIPFEIVSGQKTTKEITNHPQGDPVTILLKKQDADLGTNTPEGNASLENAHFTIRYYKGGYYTESELNGKTPTRTWIVSTDEYGFAMYHPDFMVAGSDPLYYASNGTTPTIPAGTVTVQESKAPTGYLLNDELYVMYSKVGGIKEYVNTYNEPIVPDRVIRGGVSVQKMDFELDRPTQPQGDADLAATLDIYNRSTNSVVVNGKTLAPGTIVHTMKTDAATGAATTTADLLPYGDYEVVERPGNQPAGYLNAGKTSQKFSIRQNSVIVDLKTDAGAIKNNIIRGSFYLEKWDAETDSNEAQGAGTLDASVEIVNASKHLVLVGGVEYQPGEVVYSMTLSEDGRYQSPERLLPYGTYQYREIAPPSQGYLSTGVLSGTFSIREDGENVMLNTTTTALKNAPLRGDLKGTKISDGDGKRLAGVPFEIISMTTGESHTIITDANGEFSTASSWNPHSQNTNAALTDRDGIWFGSADVNDAVGALLFDTYKVVEKSVAGVNDGRRLLEIIVAVYRNEVTIDLSTLTNDLIPEAHIFTTAMDRQTLTNLAYVSETTILVDTIYYSGLQVNKLYELRGMLMDKETGLPVLDADGVPITATKSFRALSENGNTAMEFAFDSSALRGKSVVVFEELFDEDGELTAEHRDLEDEGQTIQFVSPTLHTTSTDGAGAKQLYIHPKTKIYDVVEYTNLVPNLPHTLIGVLMDKDSNTPLLTKDGEEVRATLSFVPQEPDGSVEMVFEINSLDLAGKTVVVFEEIYYNDTLVGAHQDIGSIEQSVEFLAPGLRTEAANAGDGTKVIPVAESVTVIDTVSYTNLPVGEEMEISGVLMDKATNKPVMNDDGEPITATAKFTPQKPDGTVQVEFEFDSRELQGKELVAFETLVHVKTEKEIASHRDISDLAQMVSVGVEAPPVETPPAETQPNEPETGHGAQTGRDGLPVAALIIALGAAIAGAVILAMRKKKIRAGK